MKNNKKIKKTVAAFLACAVTCSLMPANEGFAARNNNNNGNIPSVATGGAVRPVSSGAVSGKRPENVSHGAIWNTPATKEDWDFSDISSWMDGINWDDINWGDINWDNTNWGDINWDNTNWDDIDWDDMQDMFPITGGAIGGRFPQENWPNLDWSDSHQRPVATGGAIDGEKPEDSNKHQKPVASGGAVDAQQPNRGDGENQNPADENQRPSTPDAGKENSDKETNDKEKTDKENTDVQKPDKDTADVHKPVETVTGGAVNTEVPDDKKINKEQKPEESKVPADTIPVDTVSDGAVTTTTKKKAKIKVSITKKKVKKGKKYKIKYSVVSGSGKVTFKSSNKKVATVTSKGVVTAKKKGTANITVKIANGNTKKVKITVK